MVFADPSNIIDGGTGGANVYYDLGGNSGYSTQDFAGYY
jgi:hypothetical protein